MKSGDDNVGGKGDVSSCRRKSIINRAADHITGLDGKFAQLTVLVENGSSMWSTDIHHREVRVLTACHMAVHTLVVGEVIVTECFLIKVLYATLFDLQVVPYLIVGLDETVSEVGVHFVLDDQPVERAVFRPFTVFQGGYRNFDILIRL